MKKIIFLFLIMSFSLQVHAEKKIKAVATIPDIAWVIKQIGQDHVEVKSFLSSKQDPHFADAVPKFILWASRADLLCSVGMELEVGWLPKVIEQAGNKNLHKGGKGFCDLGNYVQALEVPTGPISASMGDVHKYGNPHYWNSPKRLAFASKEVFMKLAGLRPDLKLEFEKNYHSLKKALLSLHENHKKKLQGHFSKVKGPIFVQYHKEFVYWAHDMGVMSLGAIEEKPGIPPSAGRLAQFSLQVKKEGVKMVWASKQNNRKLLEKFAELSGLPVLYFDVSVADIQNPNSYKIVQEQMLAEILKY